MNAGGSILEPDDSGYAGQRHYTRSFLRIYDPLVLGFFGSFVWRCPTSRLIDQYRRLTARRHLDVGPGTGYFLERAPVTDRLVLLDPNREVLAYAADRLRSRSPALLAGDVRAPIVISERFESVALNYVLHCLPGPMATKAAAVYNLAALLEPDAVLFGATVLGSPDLHNAFSMAALRTNNRRGIFDNLGDTEPGLREALAASFEEIEVQTVGSVAMFAARRPRGQVRGHLPGSHGPVA